MRKKAFILMASLVFVLMSSASFAVELGFKGGVHEPIDDYGDIVDTGFTVGGQIKGPISDRIFWGLHLAYSAASGEISSPGGDIDVDVTMVELYPFLDLYAFRSNTSGLFFRGGLGFNFWEIEASSGGMSSSEDGTDMMISAGLGFNFLNGFELVASFNRMFDDDDADYITATIGYNFKF